MTNLVSAYQKKEINEFEHILKGKNYKCIGLSKCLFLLPKVNKNSIMGDPFIRTYIDDVLRNIRTQVLIKLIKPYTSIEITFISKVRLHCIMNKRETNIPNVAIKYTC